MLGVKFDDLHSLDDLGLILQTVNMPMPEPKTAAVEIPGADGVLDLTDYFGDTRYNNRTITMVFTDKAPYKQRYPNQTVGANALHGKSMKICFDEDPLYYYQGRISVQEYAPQGATRTVTITADCEPYKYLVDEGAEPWKWDPFSFIDGIIRYYGEITVSGLTPVQIVGGYKAVHPIITCDSAMTVRLDDGATVQLKAGVQKVYNITVTRGEHYLYFNGSGKASLRMQIGTF